MNVTAPQSLHPLKSLAKLIEGEVHADEYYRALYSTDASIYQIRPLAVVVPRSPADVREAIVWAAEHRWPIIPRGGGTSLSGQSIGAGLVIDFSKYLNRILEIDPERQTARVEPGVILDQLNAAAARHRLQFAPDVATSSRANVGGMIGNNSAGSRSVWHGKTVDHVVELSAVLADGTASVLRPESKETWAAAAAKNDGWGRARREVESIAQRDHDEILARYPSVLRRVSGYNLDEFVPQCAARIPTPRMVAVVREREQERYPGAQFNLARMLVGAEGTLATVTEALVHLIPLPAARGLVVLHFSSLAAAVAAIEPVLASDPSAAELFDGEIVELAEKSLEYRNYLDFVVGRPESLLLVEFSGDSADEIRSKADDLTRRLHGLPGLEFVLPALEPSIYAHVWACRKAALPLLQGVPSARKPVAFVEDAAVNPARLSEFVARFRKILAANDTSGAYYGHASVGCLHIRPALNLADREDIARMERISHEVCQLVLEFGGSMSGEHGDGLARSYLNEELFGPRLYRAFRDVKRAFDPGNLMNPGKIVDGPSPVENLRLGVGYKALPLATTFDFSREGSLAKAAELCNGAGVCRKLQTGTMCPSFMVTRDEEHSTRGRANALRLALSGALPTAELIGPRLFATYDLCLGCKGCKAECPSNVDVAKLKMEFLSHYYAQNGTPREVRLMADAARLNRWGSALAPVSNWLARLPGAGWLAERTLGIDRRRPLPRFERQHFARWFRSRSAAQRGSGPNEMRGDIVLVDDCLTSFCEPAVNRSAVELLEAVGYRVHLAGLGCCGRTWASKGLLGVAQQLARENIERLRPWAERGVPIVAAEPSCLAMLVDDYLDLVPGEAARLVAAHAVAVDTHLAQVDANLRLAPARGPILVHGHCHQKALVGLQGTQAALAKIPGAEVTVVDSGCCGMAGSFGYEHYDLSMAIGERVLFPAVRQHQGPIVAPGFSCRHQIEHGTGRTAFHPVQLLAARLAEARSPQRK
ncbi:MAG TPA: FAD-linked oxidase C-terminal domain-containing protein [Pirellulales bacterium]|nr:FAD-linked oxidase C-terminal domain-containing protein [Pirellulales bacterium]